ncbi:unnamed protein product [Rotaria sordida]|uniref:Uncharacterized protein n=2 Tax=Rotaria sordida TaxID=392033 RepID=A0A815FBW3_9BILA|nr:unnamed protein product [Rotaria sordida]
MGWFQYLVLFVLFHLSLAAIRMSQPKILLPFHPRIETNFTLEATDGCFTWSSSRSDLVRIDPIGEFSIKNGENCSLHANIIAHTKQSLRSSATIYARDILTGQSVRCDVIIDKIQTIEIIYTTTRLYLEDAPELFKLRAHDQHGSTFSSIEHFPFEWKLLNAAIVNEQNVKKSASGTLDATKVIRILRLTDSSYEMSETVRNLESHGSLSYEILLEGLRTGSAFVQAEFIDNDLYHGIRTKPVRLSVSANVQFYPSTDVYLLPYSRLAFRLYQIKRQESTDITDLPSTRILYEVKLINNDAGYLDDKTLIFTATDHADEQSRLELIDRNMKAIDNETYEPTSLMIRIVNIGYLSAITNSTRPWIFQIGSYYLITVEMFDVNGRKIYPTDNLDLSASIPNDLHKTCLNLKSLYKNGTQYILRPNCQGRFEIEFHLNGMKNNNVLELLTIASTKQWFEVYLPLAVQPKRVLLPEKTIVKEVKTPYCPIKVLGGSGDYIFTSRDTSVVTVSSTGDLMEQTSLNSTIVDVFDKKSPELNASIPVQVVQPNEFHLFPCPVETELNSLLNLPIQLYYKKQALTCCSHLDFDIIIDNNIFQYQGIIPSDDHNNDSCAFLVFKPLKIGITNVRVILKNSNLQETISLSAYEKLNINHHYLLLTTKSQYTLQLSNGPLNLYDQESLKYDIYPLDNHIKFKQDSINSNLLHIKCHKPIQHIEFDISKQNPITKQNLCPIKSKISIDISCQTTIYSLSLEPILHSQCPLINRDYVITSFDQILLINIIAYNEQKISFTNFSSLNIDCSIKSQDYLADLHINNNKNQLEIIPKHKPGKILLHCSVDKIEQQLEIEFITNIQLINPIKLIYINESLSPLDIQGGSGYFKFQINDLSTNSLIELLMNETNSRLIYIKPLNYGRTNLIIIDQCLPLSTKTLDIIVSDIDQLKIFGRSRLELNTTSLIYIQAIDSDGNLFNLTNIYRLINIIIEQSLKPNILFIEYESKSNLDYQTLAYRIHTLNIGRTYVKFYALNIKSNVIEFEVYEKLHIYPKQLNILPLSTIQLMIIGGSQILGTNIEWSTNNTDIIDLEINNVFKTKTIGYAIVRAKSIGYDPLLGKSIVYGEDTCLIHVVQIHSIRLHIPTTQILPNKYVPLTVLSYDREKNPIIITDVFLHSLIFTWSLSNTHLAQFRPIIGNISSYTRTFVTNIETLRTGRINIDVRLSTNSKNLNKLLLKTSHELSSSIELNILEQFYLNQFDETRTILIGPNSRLNLFHIPNDIILELSSPSKNIHLDKNTKIIHTDQNLDGEAILYMKYGGIKQEKKIISSSIVGAYLIQVKPIHYILLQSYLPQETSSLFSSIPVDYKLPLSVSYHDELGRRFDAASISLRTFSYRGDMISTNSNNTQIYEIIPLKNGSNILVVDGGSEYLRAYLPVQANSGFHLPKSSISPLKQVYYIGDIVCFESNLNNDEKNKDRWSSDDGMYVDSKHGIGQMIMEGERHLHLKIDGQTITSERFNVQTPNEIKLFKGTNDFLYDGEEGKSSSYPVIFGADSTTNLHGSCYREGLEHAQSIGTLRPIFECHLDFVKSKLNYPKISTLFKTQPIFDLDLMSWACQIICKSSHDLSTFDDSFRLIVQTPYQINSNELIIPYQPAFKLSSSSSIYLSEEHPYNSIQISTLPTNEKYIQLISSDPSIIRITKNSTDPFLYNIELRHGAKTNNQEQIYIDIKNILTGQNQRVNIKVQKRFIDNPIGRILASLLLCASLALIIYGLANRKPFISSSTTTPIITKQISSTPRVLQSPPTPKRHLLFDDHHLSSFDSPTTIQHYDQPVVRLYSAQDLRSRSIGNSPRSAMSNMTLPTTDERDLQTRLQRLYNQ